MKRKIVVLGATGTGGSKISENLLKVNPTNLNSDLIQVCTLPT